MLCPQSSVTSRVDHLFDSVSALRRLAQLQAALAEVGPAAGTPDKAARTAASLAKLRAQAPALHASLRASEVCRC